MSVTQDPGSSDLTVWLQKIGKADKDIFSQQFVWINLEKIKISKIIRFLVSYYYANKL